MCSLLLVYAVLKTLHSMKSILNEEEYRSVGKVRLWWESKLATALVVKPPDVAQQTLDVFEEYKEHDMVAKRIKSKLCNSPRSHLV